VPTVHPTALVDPDVDLGDGGLVRPSAVLGPHVRVGAGTGIGAHSILTRSARIGHRCGAPGPDRNVSSFKLNTSQAVAAIEQAGTPSPEVRHFLDCLKSAQRGISK
jgi:hypothetical protein